MLTSDGVPNDVIGNFNCISIIVMGPILNVGCSTSMICVCYHLLSLVFPLSLLDHPSRSMQTLWLTVEICLLVFGVPDAVQSQSKVRPRRAHYNRLLHQHALWHCVYHPLL